MKFGYISSALLFAVPAFAQRINIGSPASGTALTIGKDFTVEVDKPDSQGPTRSVSVVIGLQRCGSNPCPTSNNDEILGGILYQGDYAPVRHASEPQRPPYQNFTFTLAATETPQDAVLHVSHLYLVGAGPSVMLETKNVSVTFAQPNGAKFKRAGL